MNSLKTFIHKVGDRVREVTPQGTQVLDGTLPQENLVEGFVCPTCFKKFDCPEALKKHYEEDHVNPSANYLCPVCQARLSSQKDLELHYSTNHKERDFSNDSLELLKDELIAVTSNLREERWHSEGLKKEVERLHEAFQKKDSEESDVYIHKFQLDAAEEAKSTLSSEVMHLRKQLSEALQHTGILIIENQSLEIKLCESSTEKVDLQSKMEDLYAEMETEKHCKEEALKLVEGLREYVKHNVELEEEIKAYHVAQQESDEKLKLIVEENEQLKKEVDEKEEEVKINLKNVENLKSDCEVARDNLNKKKDELNSLTAKLSASEKILEEYHNSIQPTSEEALKPENAQLLQEYTDVIAHLKKQNKSIVGELEETIKQKLDVECIFKDKACKFSSLENYTKELQFSLDETKKQLKASKESCFKREAAINELKTKNEALICEEEERQRLEGECGKLERSLNEAQTFADKSAGELVDIKMEFEDLSASNCLNISQLEDRGAELTKLKEAQESILNQFDEMVGKLAAKEAEVELLMNQRENLFGDVKLLTQQLAELQGEISACRRAAVEKEAELTHFKDMVRSLQTNVANCLKESEIEKEKRDNLIRDLEAQRESAKNDIKELEYQAIIVVKSLKQHEEEKESLAADLQASLNEIKSVRDSYDLVLETNTAYHDRIKESEVTLKRLKAHETELQDELDDVTIRLADAESGRKSEYSRVAVLDEKVGGLEAELAGLAGDKLELEVRIEAASEERQSLLNRCVSSEKEVERLQQEINLLRRKLEDSTAALHDLGLANQSLQIETVKQAGRKWMEDSDVANCIKCAKNFTVTNRRHHCRNCGQIFCNECSSKLTPLESNKKPVRVCDSCYAELIVKV